MGTLQESPSAVDPGKMPRSKEVILYGDQVDTVRPGDEISLVGIYRCLYDVATNARPAGLPPDISEVPVEMADVVRRFEQQDIDIDEAHGVMRSERFRQNFREEDGNLYRVV